MKEMFERVQGQFSELNRLLNELDFKKDLSKPDLLAELNDKLTETYVLLNDGFCESAQMCEKCVSNRDQLQLLSAMIDKCEQNKEITKEASSALEDFTKNLPQMLDKMQSVYLETMHNA